MTTVSMFNEETGTWDINTEGLHESRFLRPNNIKVRDLLVDLLDTIHENEAGIKEVRVSWRSGSSGLPGFVFLMEEGPQVKVEISEDVRCW